MFDGILVDPDGFEYDPCWSCQFWSRRGCLASGRCPEDDVESIV